MYIGQICKVRWDSSENPGEYIWHNAMIKSIEGDTITVIWEEDSWKGRTTDRIPLDWVIVRGDITSVRDELVDIKNLLANNLAANDEARRLNSEQHVFLGNQLATISTTTINISRALIDSEENCRNFLMETTAQSEARVMKGQDQVIEQIRTISEGHNHMGQQFATAINRLTDHMIGVNQRLEGCHQRLDRLNANLPRNHVTNDIFADDEVNYDVQTRMDRLQESLESLGGSSSGSINMMSEQQQQNGHDDQSGGRFHSNPEMPLYDRYAGHKKNFNKKQ